LVSAQNRRRLYWTNIGLKPQGLFGFLYAGIEQPNEKGILLKDILEEEVDEKYFISDKGIAYINRNPRNLAFQMSENDDKSGCLVARYQAGIPYNQIKSSSRKIKQLSNDNKSNGGTQPFQQDRIYDINGISPALQANLPNGSQMINTERLRRLTPIECERLQTVKDNYTNHVSDSQRYKMLGNGWTIDVIAHILSYINK
jgi:DNA (cytosine-5)-methyltransferase 3A